MTLIMSVHGRHTVWLVADRRLSYGIRRRPVDDAVKVLVLETQDGVGLLGYAGLGATGVGTQPSDWMSAVLRGRPGLSFEQALGVLADASTRELPKHLIRLPGGGHSIVCAAFLSNIGARVYTVDNHLNRLTGEHRYRYTRHVIHGDRPTPPRIALGGSGGWHLQSSGSLWIRPLLRLVRAHDRGSVSHAIVAKELARLNWETHKALGDGTVGPRCVVAWMCRQGAPAGFGGGHLYFSGVELDNGGPILPSVANGMDVRALCGVIGEEFMAHIHRHGYGGVSSFGGSGMERVERRLARMPWEPDEELR
jgi:hypothetical protein